jgi:hypothetical protein
VIGKRFPLSETKAAHAFLEAATLGNSRQLIGKVIIEN